MSVVPNSPAASAGGPSIPNEGFAGQVAAMPISLDLELARSKAEFFSASGLSDRLLHIVLGNESADLDSVCTSIAKAMYLRAQSSAPDFVAVPVMNMRREELELRRDILRVLELSGINPDNLVFMNEARILRDLAASGRLRVHLVDHNELAIGQEFLAPSVVSILDHHARGVGTFPKLDPRSCTIDRCASTATLLADEMLRRDSRLITPSLATLLLSPIVVDSENYALRGPGTKLDLDIGDELFMRSSDAFSGALYDDLSSRRKDISGLSVRELLIRDLKRYREGDAVYGITSLPGSVSWRVADDERYVTELSKLCQDRELKVVFALLWGGEAPNDRRTLKIFAPDPALAASIADQLMVHRSLGKSLSRGIPGATAVQTLHASEELPRKLLQPRLIGLNFGD